MRREFWEFNVPVSNQTWENLWRNKKIWEELFAYFSFTVIWISDTIIKKKTSVCMHNEANKTIQFGRLQCWYYWWKWYIKYAVEMASDGKIYAPSFMTIGSGICVILRVLPQQAERLQCWYYWWEGFMIYANEMTSVAWYIHVKFHEYWYRRSSNIKVLPQKFEGL
jgi:hypothetical protein